MDNLIIKAKENQVPTIFEDGSTNIEQIQYYDKDKDVLYFYEGKEASRVAKIIFQTLIEDPVI
jgi:hypothetical protein